MISTLRGTQYRLSRAKDYEKYSQKNPCQSAGVFVLLFCGYVTAQGRVVRVCIVMEGVAESRGIRVGEARTALWITFVDAFFEKWCTMKRQRYLFCHCSRPFLLLNKNHFLFYKRRGRKNQRNKKETKTYGPI
jgi:hypothetical protein